jgi:hypothetical protein
MWGSVSEFRIEPWISRLHNRKEMFVVYFKVLSQGLFRTSLRIVSKLPEV